MDFKTLSNEPTAGQKRFYEFLKELESDVEAGLYDKYNDDE